MRIVIDMQGAQSTDSRNRGIGRYTLSLVQAIARNRGEHEVFLALNGLFPDTIETIRTVFKGLVPQENIRVWQIPGPVFSSSNENDYRRRSAELVREAFLASLKPDIVLVSSLFEGLSDNVVTSIGMLSLTIPTAVILYDLIPLIQRRPYLENPVIEVWYESKLDHLRRANLLLAISESSRQEGIRYLGFPAEECINISTAADQHFQPQQIGCEKEQEIRQRYSLNRPFVMYTGGIDHRKNIEGLIRAYAILPEYIRDAHQLAIVCSIQPANRATLEKLAKGQGLRPDELVLTGFVPEEDLLALYNLCKAFVFPSWHEGFGLPALEAMSCGRAVIGANTSSLPEVIGRSDALFDPMSAKSIAEKLEEVLTKDVFRAELEQHGLEQAKCFSWDISAKQAITAFEVLHVKRNSQNLTDIISGRRPRLAYISPLPPERSGISDYSADLLPELSRHYDIDVIVAQEAVSDIWVKANSTLRTVAWFREHADTYDRVLYHFGNSHFHQHMFGLLEEVPGIVVLHDFFLSNVLANMDFAGYQPNFWVKTLYQSHGYEAVQRHFHASDNTEAVWHYPCNLGVLRGALGVVVHSENSRRLADQWYGKGVADDWAIIPLLRVPEHGIDRAEARRQLKLGNDDFVVCSFGLLGPIKLNHRLLNAWLASKLAKSANCVLIFVGENHGGGYGAELITTIRRSGLDKRIRITGWADADIFRHYLAAADIGVQLRTLSRGETSAAVLDCMNFGLPTIVNANGSMVDLPDDGVLKLSDEFDDAELIAALETLWSDPSCRQQLGEKAREIILEYHSPRSCADHYAQTIETVYRAEYTGVSALAHAVTHLHPMPKEAHSWASLAESMALAIPPRIAPRQLLVDVSEMMQRDLQRGNQRVALNTLKELFVNPPEGYRVEPVYATSHHNYRYARRFTLNFLNLPGLTLEDDVIEYHAGDIFLCLGLSHQLVISRRADLERIRNYGVQIWFTVYDLLLTGLPRAFPDTVEQLHHNWLETLAEIGNVIRISNTVTDAIVEEFKVDGAVYRRSFNIDWPHLGADISCQHLLANIAEIIRAESVPDAELKLITQVLALNFEQLESLGRSSMLPEKLTWRLEGPFDSNYSLALVNRATARALSELGHKVVLHSTEGPGDFPADERFLADNPDLAGMHRRAATIPESECNVTSRNLYPPRVRDMDCKLNFLHGYAWEETGFPHEWVQEFNESLQGIAVTSQHVKKVLIDNGVSVPISVAGNGVDHCNNIKPDKSYKLKEPGFRFLHVSSCFPRKGADVMLKAYGQAFSKKDDVILIIKTFANPHNEVHKWLADAKQAYPDYPNVLIIEDDLSDSQLKSIYEQCHALVGPSRAEGFGLPFAEAMLSGLPVITTGWAGQLDFCSPETAWLVDYTFTTADTHFELFNSVWAEPNQEHLAELMRKVYELSPQARAEKSHRGRELLLQKFKWTDVAHRLVGSARLFAKSQLLREPKIGWITTWNTKCGIAAYSKHLIDAMPQKVTVLAAHADVQTQQDSYNVSRCWFAGEVDLLEDLSQAIEKNALDTLVIQFNYGFFNFDHFSRFLENQIGQGITVILMLHSTTDPVHIPEKRLGKMVPALKKCHRLLVHTPGDLNRLKAQGLVDNVALFPHGVLDKVFNTTEELHDNFTIASYGFFLPHKGLLELIDAVKLLVDSGRYVKLKMINAEYPIPESAEMVRQAKDKVAKLGMASYVEIISDFLPDEQSLLYLSSADLIVFPYQETGESSSAAVRYGLASGKPVAVTPLAIFDDVSRAVLKLPGCMPQDLANGIANIIEDITANNETAIENKQNAEKWREAHKYSKLGKRLNNMLIALTNQSDNEWLSSKV